MPDPAQKAEASDALASQWAHEGLRLMAENSATSAETALDCFGKAIALREPLAALGNPWYRYNLAGVWINRGDLLLRLRAKTGLAEALAAFERAAQVLVDTPIAQEPLLCQRAALAWLNRGAALLRFGEADSLLDSIRSLATAAEIASLAPADAAARMVAASAWTNQADALALTNSWAAACDAASRALSLVGDAETGSADLALLGLKARLVLCARASRHFGPESAERAAAGDATGEEAAAEIAEAIERAEQALALVRLWPADPRLAGLAREFFRFGAEAYAVLQPQFLVEYLQENRSAVASAATPAEIAAITGRAISSALARVTKRAFSGLAGADIGRDLAVFRDLRQAAADIGM